MKRYRDAAQVFERVIESQQSLVDSWPLRKPFAQVLGSAYLGLGKAQIEFQSTADVEVNLVFSRQVFQRLADQSEEYSNNYANVLQAMVRLYRDSDPDLSRSILAEERLMRQIRLDANPENLAQLTQLLATEVNWANSLRKAGKYEKAIDSYRTILEKTSDIAGLNIQPQISRMILFGLGDSLSKTKAWPDALPIWEQLCRNPADPNWKTFELQRAICLTRIGRIGEGTNAAESLLGDPDVQPINYYDVACCFAVAAEILGSDAEISAVQRNVDWYRTKALNHLKSAGDAGFFEIEKWRIHAARDADLNALHDDDQFIKFCREFAIPFP